MKVCPACRTQYSDDTLSFCLQDGTPLVSGFDIETPTVTLGEVETEAVRRDRVNVPIDPASAAWQQSQVTNVATLRPPEKRSNTAVAVGATVVGMLFLFGLIGIAAWIFLKNSGPQLPQNANNMPNNTGGGLSNVVLPTPQQTVFATPASTRTPSSPIPTPPVEVSYPATTRLKLGRGAYSTRFSGDINPGGRRTMVLACRSGQSLKAMVSSADGCVSIGGGGASYFSTTNSGDNYVSVTSNCSSTVRFTIFVTII